jgi:uncharacterized membrane protein
MTVRRADAICALLVALAFIVAALMYGRLPDPVPTHWNLAREADSFTPKPWGAFVMPLATLGTWLLLRVLPAISPSGFRMDGFLHTYWLIVTLTVGTLFAISVVALLVASGSDLSLLRLVPFAIGVLFVVLGNYMGKLERNFFIGIRTPWTLANEEVWARTHRFGGKLFVLAGGLVIAAAALDWPLQVVVAVVLAAALVSVVYSLVVYWKIEGWS